MRQSPSATIRSNCSIEGIVLGVKSAVLLFSLPFLEKKKTNELLDQYFITAIVKGAGL